MKFFYRLEQKYGRYAIHNLMYYIIVMYAFGLVLMLFNPLLYFQYLSLNASAILRGQIWRLVTFMIYPPSFGGSSMSSIFFAVIALYLYYSIGRSLEQVWGAFRFNVYFFMGVVGTILAAFIGELIFHQSLMPTTQFLNLSLFLAFGITFPDIQFLLFFVIPVKAKWLAAAEAAVYFYLLVVGSASMRCEIIVSLLNVIVFFLMTRGPGRYSRKTIIRQREFRQKMKAVPKRQQRHCCAVCGRTEADGPELEFRYCSKCEGNLEYCQDHLFTHVHVTEKADK